MSFFNSNSTLILLHRGLEHIKKSAKYDIVLSPQFYIAKRETLPLKYAFQAKKLAPSVLEDLLPNEHGYEYIVQKDGDGWLFFAYSPKEIEQFLQSCCNIPPQRIGKIYFADQLKKVLQKLPVGIDAKHALTLINDFATIVPRSMLQSDRYAKFTNRLRPKSGYRFKPSASAQKDERLSRSSTVLATLLLLLGIFYLVEGFGYKKAIKRDNSALEALFSANPQLQGRLVRESIRQKYAAIEKKQRAIRTLLESLSQLTSKKSIIDMLELKDNAMVARFIVEPSEQKRVLSVAAAAGLKAKKVNSQIIEVKGVLQ